jgi:hypothetical protein
MSNLAIIDRTTATSLLKEERPLTSTETADVLRFLNRHCEDMENKVRQLKSELGRVSRR